MGSFSNTVEGSMEISEEITITAGETSEKKEWATPTYEVDPIEEARVVTMRTAQMVGKIVTGTLVATGNSRKKYWIRWNRFKRDDVWSHPALRNHRARTRHRHRLEEAPQTEEVTTVLE